MASQASLTHLFAEFSSLEDLKLPLKGSSRLRYTCMDVSRQYIALGSNTGCVYVFGRESLKHVKSVYGDVDSSSVTVVAISPNELVVGFAVSSGQVAVMEMNVDRRSKPERLRQTADHLGAMITATVWDSSSSNLFVGDSAGKVTVINVPTSKAKTIFSTPSQTIVRLDCSITQLDWWSNKLLASTLKGTYLLNTAKQQFSQIGKKPREGEFGACFFLEPSSNYPVIYCARPGSRMWEVDFDGNVLNTHQFKQLLATKPLPIVASGVDFSKALKAVEPGPQSVNFLQMFHIGEFILTWSGRGLYVFDPINVKVVLWTDTITTVSEVCVMKNEVYILYESQQVRRLLFLPILHLCAALITRQRCLLAAELLLFMEHFAVKASLLKHIKKELLPQLVGFLKEAGHVDVVEKVQVMLEDVSESSVDSASLQEHFGDSNLYPAYNSHGSGIITVNDGSTVSWDPDRRSLSRRASPIGFLSQNDGGRLSPKSGAGTRDHQPVQTLNGTSSAIEEVKPVHISEDVLPDQSKHKSSSVQLSSLEFTYSEVESQDTLASERTNGTEISDISLPKSAKDDVAHYEISVAEEAKNLSQTETSNANRMSCEGESWERSVLQQSDPEDHGATGSVTEHVHDADAMPGGDTIPVNSSHTGMDGEGNKDHVDGASFNGADGEGTQQSAGISETQVPVSHELTESAATFGQAGMAAMQNRSQSVLEAEQEKEAGTMRKVNSLPSIVIVVNENAGKAMSSERRAEDAETLAPVLNGAQRESSGSSSGIVARTTKKKKKRHVNEVEIPLAGSASGQLQRSVSMGAIKQKKKKQRETLQHMRSLDSSPDHAGEDDLYQRTDADPDTISIATISSIEEEEDRTPALSPTTPGTGADDVFIIKQPRSESTGENVAEKYLENAQRSTKNDDAAVEQQTRPVDFAVGDTEIALCFPKMDVEKNEQSVYLHAEAFQDTDPTREEDTAGNESTKWHAAVIVNDSDYLSSTEHTEHHSDGSFSTSYEKLALKTGGSGNEVIPPLIERLSAFGVSRSAGGGEEAGWNSHDSSFVKNRISVASRQKIASVKERVTKFGTTTKSLIQRVKDKNLMSRSPSVSPPSSAGLHPQASHSTSFRDEIDMSDILLPRETPPALSSILSATCVIDLSPFLKRTEQTQKQLKDHSVLLNPVKLKEVLNTWAEELNQTLVTYHLEVFHQEMQKRKKEKEEAASRSKETDNQVPGKVKTLETEFSPSSDKMSRDLGSPVDPEMNNNTTDLTVSEDSKIDLCNGVHTRESKAMSLSHSEDPGEQRNNQNHDKTRDSAANDVRDSKRDIVSDLEPDRDPHSAGSRTHSSDLGNVPSHLEEGSNKQDIPEKTSNRFLSSERSFENKSPGYGVQVDDSIDAESDSEVDLDIDWRQVCHVKDPFHLPPQQHMLVSNLVSHCVECGCFGNAATIFSFHPEGPKTINAKGEASHPVPSSVESFGDADSGSASLTEKLSAQKGDVSVSSASHDQPTGATSMNSTSSSCQNHHSPSSAASVTDASQPPMPESDESVDTFDKERALFVKLYYHFLSHWRLRRLLVEDDGREAYATWCALVACCQALGHGDIVWMKIENRDITGAFDYLRSGILPHKQAFLGHIASLFALSPMKVTDFTAEVPRQVKLDDLLNLCRLHSKSQLQMVTRYLPLRLGSAPSHSRNEFIKQMCTTRETKLAVLECLLQLHISFLSSSSASLTSDARLKASADNSKLPPETVTEALETVLSLLKRADSASALDACWKHRYWPGCLTLLKESDQWQRALQLEVRLNDINLLNGHTPFGFTPRNAEEWKYLLQMFQQSTALSHLQANPSQPFNLDPSTPPPTPASRSANLSSVSSSPSLLPMGSAGENVSMVEDLRDSGLPTHSQDPRSVVNLAADRLFSAVEFETDDADFITDGHTAGERHLTWLSLGLLAAQSLGAKMATKLLQDCFIKGNNSGSDGCFSTEVYTTFLLLSALERKQMLVVHNMLEKVDSYLWAKKPVHVTPQVHYAATQEKSALHTNSARENHYHHNLFSRLSGAPVHHKQLAEDPDCHWGVKANMISTCEVCHVQVTETVSHLEPGVYTFKCGHVFHKICVPDKQCPLC
ncbi:serine-rich adhesin for platelets-like isoform X2 [Littorina saxatilis]|uniref:serine-rich adhesin for platelets-like isoform X2 n=1 Tax=Littorina saxatilis TaxID=31220 RepID=UPI0038B5FE7C